jgi:WD40 repeat protein
VPVDNEQGRRLLGLLFGEDAEPVEESVDSAWPEHRDADDRYAPAGLLGRGGMGEVWAAQDRYLDRPVAMKVLAVSDPAAEARFLREARITARLDHPNIVPVHDIGVDAEGRRYFTMKQVRGGSLQDRLAEGTLGSLVERVDVFRKICAAMEFAHTVGVVHRDLKPANVMVGDHGEVLVSDWGLGRRLDQSELDPGPQSPADPHQTQTGTVMGTPAFMSPEQARGALEELGPRSDIYALGALLHTLLAGGPPDSAPLPPETPKELVHLLRCAMEQRPEDRYASVAEMDTDVVRWLEGRTLPALRYSPIERLARWVSRHHKAVRAGVAVSVVASLLLVLGARRYVSDVTAARDRAMEQAQVAEAARQEATARELESHVALATVYIDQGRTAEAREELDLARSRAQALGTEPLSLLLTASYLDAKSPPPSLRWRHPEGVTLRRQLLSPDGDRALTLDDEGGVHLHDLRVGSSAGHWAHDPEQVRDVAFYKGQASLVRAADGRASLERLSDGASLRELEISGPVHGAMFSQGVLLVFGPQGSELSLPWGEAQLPQANAALCLGPKGEVLVGYTVVRDRNRFPDALSVWDTRTGEELHRMPAATHAACHPKQAQVAILGDGVAVRSLDSGQLLWEATAINSSELRYSGDGHELLVWTRDGGLLRFHAETGALLGQRRVPLGQNLRSEAGPWVVSASDDAWQLWLKEARPLELSRSKESRTSLDLSADGVLIAAAGLDPTVEVRDSETGRLLRSIPSSPKGTRDVRFSPSGERLLLAGRDGVVRLVDLHSGEQTLLARPGGALAMSGAWWGDSVLVVYEDCALVEWGAEGSVRRELSGPQSSCWDLRLDPSGRYALTTGRGVDPEAVVWDLETGSVHQVAGDLSKEAYRAAFSASGRYVVGSQYGTPLLAQGVDDVSPRRFPDLREVAMAVGFSPDERMVVTGTLDGRLVFLDPETMLEILSFRLHETPITDLRVRGDGVIFSVDAGGSLRRFDPGLSHAAASLQLGETPTADYQNRLAVGAALAGQWAHAHRLQAEGAGLPQAMQRARAALAAGDVAAMEQALEEAVSQGTLLPGVAKLWRPEP